jgi:phytoene synthase
MAMQLTNICRDVLEDWQRGRLYVPLELLGGLDPRPGEPLARPLQEALRSALPRLLNEAERLYRPATPDCRRCPGERAVAIKAARLIYAA